MIRAPMSSWASENLMLKDNFTLTLSITLLANSERKKAKVLRLSQNSCELSLKGKSAGGMKKKRKRKRKDCERKEASTLCYSPKSSETSFFFIPSFLLPSNQDYSGGRSQAGTGGTSSSLISQQHFCFWVCSAFVFYLIFICWLQTLIPAWCYLLVHQQDFSFFYK